MASFFEDAVDAVHENLDAGIGKFLFRVSQDHHHIANRVVWIPRGGRIDGALEGKRTVASTQDTDETRLVPLCLKSLVVEARLTAATFEDLEALHADVLNAVQAGMHKASIAGSFEIVSESDAGAGNLLSGIALLVQQFIWQVVVTKQTETLVIAADQEHECTLIAAETEITEPVFTP